MGYFSEMDLMQYEATEQNCLTEVQQLTERIDTLNNRLIDLEGQCPRDMGDPVFDRMFYSECLEETCADEDTIQGTLQSIRRAEEQLRFAKEEERRVCEERERYAQWRSAVWETGATPDHQIVLMSAFFPAADPSVAA